VASCGDERASARCRIMATWKRIRVLVLLACGLVTAPFGSLEQFDAAGDRNVTVPCLSRAEATPLPLTAPTWRANLPARLFALPVEWSLTIPQTEWQQAVVRPRERPGSITYYANAPPSHLI